MKARMRSAVASVGERPRRKFRTREGSPTAWRPNSVGLKPVRSRNSSTVEWNCSVSVFMIGIFKSNVSYCVNLKKLLISYHADAKE